MNVFRMAHAYSVSITRTYGTKEITMIFNGKKVDVLAEEFKQRAFDGKWERIVKIMDLDNS